VRAAAGRGWESQAVHKGLTIVEILIVVVILGILALIVSMELADASAAARETSLAKDLQMVRRQIGVFKNHHTGTIPGQGDEDIVAQLTGKTDDAGAVTVDGPHGPYMPTFPTNPFTNTSTVECGTGSPGGGDYGWYYNTETGNFWADDDAHKDL